MVVLAPLLSQQDVSRRVLLLATREKSVWLSDSQAATTRFLVAAASGDQTAKRGLIVKRGCKRQTDRMMKSSLNLDRLLETFVF